MLIADEVGLLRFAYGLADFAVVGGGWGRGVHNVFGALQPLVHRFCADPKWRVFREIEALKKAGALQCLSHHSRTVGQMQSMD